MRILLFLLILPFALILLIPVGAVAFAMGAALFGVVVGLLGAVFGIMVAVGASIFAGLISLGAIGFIFGKIVIFILVIVLIVSLFSKRSTVVKSN